jgi:hypothetical protein
MLVLGLLHGMDVEPIQARVDGLQELDHRLGGRSRQVLTDGTVGQQATRVVRRRPSDDVQRALVATVSSGPERQRSLIGIPRLPTIKPLG